MSNRPRRLTSFTYVGLQRYSLTFCTHQRRRVFTAADIVDEAIGEIVRAATDHAFAVLAYCFMPDHAHLLVEGRSKTSDLVKFANAVKQRIGYRYRRRRAETLWQKGYYEHVVRNDEATISMARYIVANPVRAGLAKEPHDYPFSGSLVFDKMQLNRLWESGTNVGDGL